MKKWIALALAGTLMLMTACGSKTEQPPEYEVEIVRPEQTSAPAQQPAATPAPVDAPEEIWQTEPRMDIEIVESLAEQDPAVLQPGEWHNPLSLFQLDGGVGVIDQEGKIRVPASEQVHWCWNCGLTNEDESKIFNENGEVIGTGGHGTLDSAVFYDPDQDVLYQDSTGLLIPWAEVAEEQDSTSILTADVVSITPDPETGLYDLNGVMMAVSESRGKMLFKGDGSKLDGVVYEETQKESEGIVAAKKDGKWGFVNAATGEQLLPFVYSQVRPFHQDLAAVETENGWTYVGTGGGARTYTGFLNAATAQDGKAWVKTEKGWGVIRLEDWPAQ